MFGNPHEQIKAAFDRQNFAEVQRLCDSLLQTNASDFIALTYRGTINALSNSKQALKDLSHALQIQPGDAWTLRSRAQANYMLENYAAAKIDAVASLKKEPDNAFSLAYLGAAEYALEQYDNSLRNLKRSLQLNPKDAFALSARANTWLKLNNQQAALEDATASLAIEEDPDVRNLYKDLTKALNPTHHTPRRAQPEIRETQSQQKKRDEFKQQFFTIEHDLKNNINLHTLEARYKALESDALRLKHSGFFESRGDFYFQNAKKMHSPPAQRKPYSDAVTNYTMALNFSTATEAVQQKLQSTQAALKIALQPCRDDLTPQGIEALEKKKAELRAQRGSAAQVPRKLTLMDLNSAQRATLDQMLAQMRQQSRVVSHSPPPPTVPARTYLGSATEAAATTKTPAPTLRATPPARTLAPTPPPVRAPPLSASSTRPRPLSPTARQIFQKAVEYLKNKQLKEAIQHFKAVDEEDAEVQYHLGLCYEESAKKGDIGKLVNLKSAIQWYRKAKDKGHALAQTNLAKLIRECPELAC